MDTLDGFRAVMAVAETGSFTAAALRLGLSKAVISKYINNVESQFATKIFTRTTRKVSLTRAGRKLYQTIVHILDEYSCLIDQVQEERSQHSGLLRITTSVTFGEQLLAPKLPQFISLFPNIQLEIELSNRKVDLIAENFDLALRVGSVGVQDFVATPIRHFTMLFCASKLYLEHHGVPHSFAELAQHKWLIDNNVALEPWHDQGLSYSWLKSLRANITQVNSPAVIKSLVLANQGVALLPEFLVLDEIRNGQIQVLMPELPARRLTLHAIYPESRYVPEKSRVFIEFLKSQFCETNIYQ
ncbi:LysR family transcriptional regulator [Pseudoalteromonas fenneropenaei]|uniref:LysR family transcriptional regulator n=1 Tax=Pseudoalteromonas fenneropenaei TaxID=1737459 RepID=A0ABV7CEU9_9GAMM